MEPAVTIRKIKIKKVNYNTQAPTTTLRDNVFDLQRKLDGYVHKVPQVRNVNNSPVEVFSGKYQTQRY